MNKRVKPNNNKITQAQATIITGIITTLGVIISGFFVFQAAVAPKKIEIDATKTAQVNMTTSVSQSTINSISTQAKKIYGPSNGELLLDPTSITLPSNSTGVYLQNFIVETKFINPYDKTEGNWDYGFGFRSIKPGWEYRFYVNSSGSWVLYISGEHNPQIQNQILQQGLLDNLDTNANGSNTILLNVNNQKGDFYLNGAFITNLDLSVQNVPGDIYIGSGFDSGSTIAREKHQVY